MKKNGKNLLGLCCIFILSIFVFSSTREVKADTEFYLYPSDLATTSVTTINVANYSYSVPTFPTLPAILSTTTLMNYTNATSYCSNLGLRFPYQSELALYVANVASTTLYVGKNIWSSETIVGGNGTKALLITQLNNVSPGAIIDASVGLKTGTNSVLCVASSTEPSTSTSTSIIISAFSTSTLTAGTPTSSMEYINGYSYDGILNASLLIFILIAVFFAMITYFISKTRK